MASTSSMLADRAPIAGPSSVTGGGGGGAETASPTSERPQTLYFPTLHLGSFHNLTPDSFPSPTESGASPRKVSPTSPRHREPFVPPPLADTQQRGPGKKSSTGGDSARMDNRRPSTESRRSSESVSRARQRTGSSAGSPFKTLLTLDPLPPVPSISPITFTSPGGFGAAVDERPATSRPMAATTSQRSVSASSVLNARVPTLREPPERLNRPLGHALTIHIPPQEVSKPLVSPSNSLRATTPVLKTSPGLPRRRTIVEAGNEAVRASPIRMSQVMDSLPVPDGGGRESPEGNLQRRQDLDGEAVTVLGQPVTSEPQDIPMERRATIDQTPQKRQSSAGSPTSPTPRRSLPKPPKSGQMSRTSMQDLRAPATSPPQGPRSVAPPMAGSSAQGQTWAAAPDNAVSDAVLASMPFVVSPAPRSSSRTPEPRATAIPLQPSRPGHQQSKSASALPVVGGLSDAGPYPTANPDRRSGQSAAAAAAANRQPVKQVVPQEEICLECMMRDRDLADVTVSGPRIWDRASDADWADLAQREQEIMRISSLQLADSLSQSQLASLDGSSEETAPASPVSTSNSIEEQEAQRRLAAHKRKKEILRQKRKEVDAKVNNLGWRGFKWEEGSAGEGFPKGFRGNKGGPLSEAGIKAVMAKFPSASAHRYNYLQGFLRNQYGLVQEIAAEAQRLGRYPEPDEVSFASYDSEPCAPISQASGSQALVPPRDPMDPTTRARALSAAAPGVRSSPSTPANLAAMARGRPTPLAISQRPMTHFIVDREPISAPLPMSSGSLYDAPLSHMGARTALSPTLAQMSISQTEVLDDDPWASSSPPDSTLRPFSFAVRAGATHARGGSEGHGRRSILGRWGGSVTSFFGGSQAGSGSMIDMQYVDGQASRDHTDDLSLGLDNERGSRASAANVRDHPRAVSMASPTRPSFFPVDSRGSSVDGNRPRDTHTKMSKSMSQSRLSQMLAAGEDDEFEGEKQKTKGLKGLLKKIKPKSRKGSKTHLDPVSNQLAMPAPSASPRPYEGSDAGTSLAPPPPMSYLAGGRRDSNHTRNGSDSSTMADSAISVGQPGHHSPATSGYRSVSAPVARSSLDSQSLSPTSSRYLPNGKRESFASGRRQSATLVDDDPSRSIYYDAAHSRDLLQGYPGGSATTSGDDMLRAPALYGRRPHNKTNSSFSASSMVETPPPGPPMPAFFVNQSNGTSSVETGGARGSVYSPNRFKNLPPLPGGSGGEPDFKTPDSMSSGMLDQQGPDFPSDMNREYDLSTATKANLPPRGTSMAPSNAFEYAQPVRPSFDSPMASRGGSFDLGQDGRYPTGPYGRPPQPNDTRHRYDQPQVQQYGVGRGPPPAQRQPYPPQSGHPDDEDQRQVAYNNGRQAKSMYEQPGPAGHAHGMQGGGRPWTQYSTDVGGGPGRGGSPAAGSAKQSGYAAYGGFEPGAVKQKKGIKGWFNKGAGRLA